MFGHWLNFGLAQDGSRQVEPNCRPPKGQAEIWIFAKPCCSITVPLHKRKVNDLWAGIPWVGWNYNAQVINQSHHVICLPYLRNMHSQYSYYTTTRCSFAIRGFSTNWYSLFQQFFQLQEQIFNAWKHRKHVLQVNLFLWCHYCEGWTCINFYYKWPAGNQWPNLVFLFWVHSL